MEVLFILNERYFTMYLNSKNIGPQTVSKVCKQTVKIYEIQSRSINEIFIRVCFHKKTSFVKSFALSQPKRLLNNV